MGEKMFQQPIDFREESAALYDLVARHEDGVFELRTQFKNWTINDVLTHLHVWNIAADLSLKDADAFAAFFNQVGTALQGGNSLRPFETSYLNGLCGRALLEAWRNYFVAMTERFLAADPKKRVKWAGPDMSVRSSITARLMETWAHGQEVYDTLGVERVNRDRIKNIAVLGVNTFGWTFTNRGLDVPRPAPQVRLRAPSGELWTWNDASEDNLVEGDATEFCQVVTQVRNIADTKLRVVGEVAKRWMSIAQCFAGPPETPPPPGARFRQAAK
jgi:uncharacterized protein (TIGR03084 family)